MARIDFYEQISDFVRKNQHLGARFVSAPTKDPCTKRVAISGKIWMYKKDKIKMYKNVQKHFVQSTHILPL